MHHRMIRAAGLVGVALFGLAFASCDRSADRTAVAADGDEAPTSTKSAVASDEKHDSAAEGDPQEPRRADESTPAKEHPANRLAKETSPYLLLHAHNPVDWYPWGEEALAKARQENKLIFLSIGYSSCHWCHVMERNVFMDEKIAEELNKNFVCIKVDREERPDVDDVYMTSLHVYFQVIGSDQSGGWPLSIFLTPDAKPLLGGTYMPPEMFTRVTGRLETLWKEQPEELVKVGDQLADYVRQTLQQRPDLQPVKLDSPLVDRVMASLQNEYDADNGGFGRDPQRPKFPEASNLAFLEDRMRSAGDTDAKRMLLTTLEKMSAGGIYDHVGGGFHRYTVDGRWQIPHFEKMLYDNAQLASLYARAWEATKNPAYRRALEGTLAFVLREMTDEQGGFYSALDAESDGEEGKFYVWTSDELGEALDKDEFELVGQVYGVDGPANFEGQYVLLRKEPLAAAAKALDTSEEKLAKRLAAIHAKLLSERAKRKRPLTDTKILTAWNGQMIRGLADAGRLLDQPRYTAAAAKAADFVLANLRTKDGRLLRTYTAGEAKLNAYLDDYALLVDGLIALYQATGQQRWLDEADALTQKQIELLWDKDGGGFFFTTADHETLFVRNKPLADSATPAGNSVAADNLLFLAKALDKPDYAARAEKTIAATATLIERSPTAAPRMAAVLARWLRQGAMKEESTKPEPP